MRKKKIIGMIFLILMILTIGTLKVQAASSASITASSTTAYVGDQVNITIKYTAAAWSLKVKGSGITEVSYVDVTSDLSETTKSETINLDTSKAGTYTISLTGEVTDGDGNTTEGIEKSVTVTVKEKEETPTVDNNTSTDNNATDNNSTSNNTSTNNNTNTSSKKSSEARLRDLGITPNDFKGFKSDTYEYSVEVPNNVEKVSIYAKTKDTNAKIKSGTGTVTLNEGENQFKIVTVAQDGETSKTYTLNITRAKTEVVPATNVETEEPETESTETQSTEATTEPTTELTTQEELGLKKLQIEDLTLSPSFSTKTYEYKVELKTDLSTLKITAEANKDTAEVEIYGNKDLKEGENTITIIVSDAQLEESATYQITVNKNVENVETVASVNWLEPSTWGLRQYIIIGILIVLIIIIIVAIILKIKLAQMDDDDEIEFPGAEELDKAMSEHQELTENEDFDEENDVNEIDKSKEYDAQIDEEQKYEENKTEFKDEAKYEEDEIEYKEEKSHKNKVKRKGKHF